MITALGKVGNINTLSSFFLYIEPISWVCLSFGIGILEKCTQRGQKCPTQKAVRTLWTMSGERCIKHVWGGGGS